MEVFESIVVMSTIQGTRISRTDVVSNHFPSLFFAEIQIIVGWKPRVNKYFIDSLICLMVISFLAYNFHDGGREHLALINVHGGSDALSAFWHDLGSETRLYASHADFLCQVASNHDAHW